MGLKDCLTRVISGYAQARTQVFAKHPLAAFIRSDFRTQLKRVASGKDRLIFKGSAGQGVWARAPWFGIFDPIVTSSAQTGYYPVYLFREDLAGVYLSLNQGVTEARVSYKANAKVALRAKAANFRALLGPNLKQFSTLEIALAPSSPANDSAFYEAGNICAKFYPSTSIPSDEELAGDLLAMLALYENLIELETSGGAIIQPEDDEPIELFQENTARLRVHKRIERNAKLARTAKEKKGAVCEVCAIDFSKMYGDLGNGYIEAHHLRPLSSFKDQIVALDPIKDFAMLCANCHRMVHRSGLFDDIQEFKKRHYFG